MRNRRISRHQNGHTLSAALGLVSLIAASACGSSPQAAADGDDPVAALRSSAQSTRYNGGYWKEQGRAAATGTNVPARERWMQALAYCGEAQPRPGLEADGAKPNCAAVRFALFELNTERSMREVRARVEADEARRRSMTPAQARARLDSAFKY